MRFLFCSLFLIFLLPVSLFAQKNFDDTVYYMKTMEKVAAKYAYYFRPPVEKIDATHYRVTYYTMDGKIKNTYVLIPKLIDYNYSLELSVAIKDGEHKIYKNGILTTESAYTMNKASGYWRFMEDDGVVFAEGNYSNGNQAGDWKYYYQGKLSKIINFEDTTGRYYYYTEYKPSGVKRLEGYITEVSNGGKKQKLKQGTWLYYYDNGKLKRAFDYKYDLLDGMYAFYDSVSGNKTCLGWHKNDLRDSLFTMYYPSGHVKIEVWYKNGKHNGKFTKYDDSSGKVVEIGYYKDDMLVGTWYEYFKGTDIIKEQTDYINNVGNAVKFDKVTNKKIAEGPYTGSDKNGVWKYYNANSGTIWKTETYKLGELSGEVIYYNADGSRKSVASYISGRLNGANLAYYDDGKTLWFIADYQNDTLQGLLETFYENGKPKRKQKYLAGNLTDGTCYDIDGKEIRCKPFFENASFQEDVMTYIGRNLKYPENAKSMGLEGKVTIGFFINESGLVKEPSIVKGFDDECNEEALRLISQMPPWIPAKADDRPVSSYHTLPIVFWLH